MGPQRFHREDIFVVSIMIIGWLYKGLIYETKTKTRNYKSLAYILQSGHLLFQPSEEVNHIGETCQQFEVSQLFLLNYLSLKFFELMIWNMIVKKQIQDVI